MTCRLQQAAMITNNKIATYIQVKIITKLSIRIGHGKRDSY